MKKHEMEAAEVPAAKRKDVLENKLKSRLMREELIEKGVLMKGDVSPSLLQRQHDLEKSKMQDKLSHSLAQRPSVDALQSRNILPPSASNGSAGVDAAEREMARLQISD